MTSAAPGEPGRDPRPRAALLTPSGRGGISVISVAGPAAARLVWRRFRPKSGVPADRIRSGRLYYGHFTDGNGNVIDEVLVAILDAGCEHLDINCHGGVVPSRLVLRELAALDVEVVSWRDLPARSHLLTDTDLLQQEALEALVRAPSQRAAQMLACQWQGALSREVRGLIDNLTTDAEGPSVGLEEVIRRLSALLATERWGLSLTEPPRVVLGGRVNVGKSSLANALHQAERYLVDEQPGTTRDLLPGLITVDGLPVELIDAAGIRETEDAVEALAVEHSRRGLREAELVVVVLDGSRALLPEEREFVEWLGDAPKLAVVNKCDLPRMLDDEEVEQLVGGTPIRTSAVNGEGLTELRRALASQLFGEVPEHYSGPVVFARRQVVLLSRAQKTLEAEGIAAQTEAVRVLEALLG